MRTLPHPDNLNFDAAKGWLMLGDTASAKAELAKLSTTSRAAPHVLEVEWSIHAEAEAWAEAYATAEHLVQIAPERASGWIHRAYAVRRMPGGGLARAWDVLRPAYENFPRQFLVPYNLSCYASQMGRLSEAWEWLQRAMKLGRPETIRKMALADADLKPLWPRLKSADTG